MIEDIKHNYRGCVVPHSELIDNSHFLYHCVFCSNYLIEYTESDKDIFNKYTYKLRYSCGFVGLFNYNANKLLQVEEFRAFCPHAIHKSKMRVQEVQVPNLMYATKFKVLSPCTYANQAHQLEIDNTCKCDSRILLLQGCQCGGQ